jgi:hypothetical protein
MTEKNETSTDITFQASGILKASLTNNVVLVGEGPNGLALAVNPPVYGPAAAPPAAWVSDTDYFPINGNCPLFNPFGAFVPLTIGDMSSNKVSLGKTYAFSVGMSSGNFISVQLYFMITGVPGGSTVLPGFGLANLPGNPGGWTYITPQTGFTGDFQIGVRNPYVQTVMHLSVEYAAAKVYMSSAPSEARLNFTISGAADTTSFFLPSPEGESRPGLTPENAICYLDPRSDPYVMRTADEIAAAY